MIWSCSHSLTQAPLLGEAPRNRRIDDSETEVERPRQLRDGLCVVGRDTQNSSERLSVLQDVIKSEKKKGGEESDAKKWVGMKSRETAGRGR